MAADMMKNMSPEDFQRMSAMAGAAGGMPRSGAGDACSPDADMRVDVLRPRCSATVREETQQPCCCAVVLSTASVVISRLILDGNEQSGHWKG